MRKNVILLLFMAFVSIPHLFLGNEKRLEILFTGDLHSSADYMALYDFVAAERAAAISGNTPLIVVDAGDIAMGSVFHTLYREYAFELKALCWIGYDAFTVGNHDFDFGADGFLSMLASAYSGKNGNENACRLTAANISFRDNAADSLFGSYNNEYIVIERSGIKIAIFGLLGEDAYSCITGNGTIIREDASSAAERICDSLEKNVKPDYIVALSHGGTMWAGNRRITAGCKNEMKLRAKSEDGILAESVPRIDVIISGHDHDALFEPAVVDNTVIAASGVKGRYVGKLLLEGDSIAEYALVPLERVNKRPESMSAAEKNFGSWLDSSRARVAGIFEDREKINIYDTIAFLKKDYARADDNQWELPLARHIAMSYASAASRYSGGMPLAVLPYGTIREGLERGAVTYGDAFEVLSLGMADDGSYGSPLVYAYIKGKDLKDLCELNAVAAKTGMEDEHLFFAGVSYSYNRYRLPFARVTDVYVNGSELDKNALYPIVTDLYTSQLLGRVRSSSFGLLNVTPRDSLGKEAGFVTLPVKGWRAFAEYLKENDIDDAELPVSAVQENGKGVLLLYICLIPAVWLSLSGMRKHCRRS